MTKIFGIAIWASVLPFVLSCNVYAPLTKVSSAEDHMEEAQKCLHEGNFACAISHYEALPAGATRTQKLCTVNLARAGFTLSGLIKTITQSKDTVLGELANGLGKWDDVKAASAVSAVDYCKQYGDLGAESGDLGVLLKTVSLFVDCANRISKSDQFVGTSESDDDCSTAGNNSGTITKKDISGTSDGSISASKPGMCHVDVVACLNDVLAVPQSQLEGSGLGDIKGAYDNVPAALKDSTSAASVIRDQLKGIISN